MAFCYKETLNVQAVVPSVPVPSDPELLTLKIIDSDGKGLLCVRCYRPSLQGTALLDFLTDNLDSLMTKNQCERVVIIGDLNQHIVRDAFNTLLVVHDLHNHVTCPTHISGSSLDPVVTDLPHRTVQCLPLDFVGTSVTWLSSPRSTSGGRVRKATPARSGDGRLLIGKPSELL